LCQHLIREYTHNSSTHTLWRSQNSHHGPANSSNCRSKHPNASSQAAQHKYMHTHLVPETTNALDDLSKRMLHFEEQGKIVFLQHCHYSYRPVDSAEYHLVPGGAETEIRVRGHACVCASLDPHECHQRRHTSRRLRIFVCLFVPMHLCLCEHGHNAQSLMPHGLCQSQHQITACIPSHLQAGTLHLA
jgi:hypothetical protein